MKQYTVLLIEDQPNQYKEIISKISSYEIPFLQIINIGPTIESKYLDYIQKIQLLEHLPTILLVDYELAWKARSSSANGHDVVNNILHLYPDEGLPFVIFISGPYFEQIKDISHVFDFIDEKANSIPLDKAKFDLIHTKTGYTMLQFAVNKGIIHARQSLKIPTVIRLENVYSYPNLLQMQSDKKKVVIGDFNKKTEGTPIEIDLKNLLLFMFKTSTSKGYMIIVSYENNQLVRWLKPIRRANLGYWINNFRSAGIDFWLMTSLFCNPNYFDYSETSIITKTDHIYTLLEYDFKSEFALFENAEAHPFYQQINSIKPPFGSENRFTL